jgi:hypothetical protein
VADLVDEEIVEDDPQIGGMTVVKAVAKGLIKGLSAMIEQVETDEAEAKKKKPRKAKEAIK